MTLPRRTLIALGLLAPAACSTATPPAAHRGSTAVSDPPTSDTPAEGATDPSTVAPSTTTEPEPEPTTTVLAVTVPPTSAPRRSTTTVTLYEPPSPQGRSTRQDGEEADSWSALADCESGGDPTTDTGNGYYGAFQFSLATWRSVGESGNPADYSYAYQLAAARRLQARSGWSQWPACARRLGLV